MKQDSAEKENLKNSLLERKDLIIIIPERGKLENDKYEKGHFLKTKKTLKRKIF